MHVIAFVVMSLLVLSFFTETSDVASIIFDGMGELITIGFLIALVYTFSKLTARKSY